MLFDWKGWINAQWEDTSGRACPSVDVAWIDRFRLRSLTRRGQLASGFALCAAPLVCPQSVVEIGAI
jgi:hypothetical protein